MNAATHKVRSDDDAQVRESSSKFPNFECPVGSKPNNTHMVNCHMACSQSTMLKFATEFDDTLVSISEEAPNHKMILARCGMNFSHKFTNVDISKFKEFAKKIRNNLYFTFSLAGVKQDYQDPIRFQTRNIDIQNTTFIDNTIAPLMTQLRQQIKTDILNLPSNTGGSNHFIEIGIQIASSDATDGLILRGKDMKPKLKDILR